MRHGDMIPSLMSVLLSCTWRSKPTDEAIKFATRAIKESDPRNEESYSLLVLCGDLSVKVKNYADALNIYSQADEVSEFASTFKSETFKIIADNSG